MLFVFFQYTHEPGHKNTLHSKFYPLVMILFDIKEYYLPNNHIYVPKAYRVLANLSYILAIKSKIKKSILDISNSKIFQLFRIDR